MDIIKFLNSKDIAEHLKKTDYRFSPIEAAFVVNESRNATLCERHLAWKEIIKNYPNEILSARRGDYGEQPLSEFLKKFIALQNKYVEEFTKDGDAAIYCYEYFDRCDGAWSNRGLDNGIYHTFNKCWNAVTSFNKEFDVQKVKVYKNYIESSKRICVTFLPDKTVLNVSANGIPDSDNDILEAFEWFWINIPTPFKKGDILVDTLEPVWRYGVEPSKVIVLTDMSTWGSKELKANGYKNGKTRKNNVLDFENADRLLKKNTEYGDRSDMGIFGYMVNENGTLYRDHTVFPTYLDLEYYKGELSGVQSTLKAVSNYIKGEISVDLLMRAYYVTSLKKVFSDEIKFLSYDFLPEGLNLAGIDL